MDENAPQPQPSYMQPPPQIVYMQPPPPVPAQPKTSGFAITALVTGIVGLVFSWVPLFDVILAAIAITFGALGWHAADTRGVPGKGMAIAGLTMGSITLVIFVILLSALGHV